MEVVSTNRSHSGVQGVYTHASSATGTPMTFSVFVPDHAPGAKLPVLWYLSGLTCTHANVTEKGEFRAAATQGKICVNSAKDYGHGPRLVESPSIIIPSELSAPAIPAKELRRKVPRADLVGGHFARYSGMSLQRDPRNH